MGIARLSLEARVLYTGYAVFMLLGGLSSAWLFLDLGLGVSGNDAARYYLGAAPELQSAPQLNSNAAAGPALHLPDDTSADSREATSTGPTLHLPPAASTPTPGRLLQIEKPARQVIETFHFHLFTMPVCLLIIAHLFMMTRLGRRWKVGIILTGTLATFMHLVAPLLVRFVSSAAAVLVFPSAIVMTIAWLLMAGWPIVEMWRPTEES